MLGYVVGIVVLILWIWALIDILRVGEGVLKTFPDGNSKLIWILIILVIPFAGVIIYAIVEKRLFMRKRSNRIE